MLCFKADPGAKSPEELGLRAHVINGSYVPDCWNAHIKWLGYVAYCFLGVELICGFLLRRWINKNLQAAPNLREPNPDNRNNADVTADVEAIIQRE